MKELDLVMNLYLDTDYDSLPEEEKSTFRDFLTIEDPEIYSWIMGRTTPHESYVPIITRLQTLVDRPIGS
jgi:succinate dehydrogenase flavin-adding protein (antitoxin of CptAB toxin-antitoxin module)